MRARDFIVEYDRNKTVKNWKSKILDKLRNDPNSHYPQQINDIEKWIGPNGEFFKNPGYYQNRVTPEGQAELQKQLDWIVADVLKQFEAADPTPNKRYVQWLARAYVLNVFTFLEDVLTEGPDFLENWEKETIANSCRIRDRLGNRRINLRNRCDRRNIDCSRWCLTGWLDFDIKIVRPPSR